jgi:hypothetical protein
MRSVRFNLSALHPVRILFAICVSVLLVFSQALPAFSASVNPTGSPTAPQQGEAQLRDIEKEAQKAAIDKPYSLKETQSKAQEGLNEIQGAADANKMSRPENAQATSVEDKIKNALDSVTGKN